MTVAPSHRLSHRLIEHEAYRRIMAGEAPETLSELAQQILVWFRKMYPSAPAVTLNNVEDCLRDTWHRRHELIRGG